MGDERRPADERVVMRNADEDQDTEGHRVPSGDRVAPDGAIGPGEKLLRGDGTPADLHDLDTEGHLRFRRRPSDGGE